MNGEKLTFGAIGAGLSYIFGRLDSMLMTLLIFIFIDFISGFIRAWVKKEFESRTFYIGGVKKIGILAIVAIATQLDRVVMGDNIILRSITISYYIANEAFSVLENYGGLGLPLPKALKDSLKKLREDNDDDNQ
jgi:toxin secretion/phage lysis holin